MSENKPSQTVAKLKRKRKKKSILNYLLLFICIFSIFVFIFLSGIKSYTPTADVTIGNNELSSTNDNDVDFEIKSVDERLKWIQMEDDLPTVAIRESKTDEEIDNYTINTQDKEEKETVKQVVKPPQKEKKDEQQKIKAPKPSIKEITNEKTDVKIAKAPTPVVPLPTKPQTNTKVYLGNYSSLEDAMIIQKKVNQDFPNTSAFIKATNDYYMVQLGSFSDKEKANSFIIELKEKGYNPKTL